MSTLPATTLRQNNPTVKDTRNHIYKAAVALKLSNLGIKQHIKQQVM